MSTITDAGLPTLANWANFQDPNGKIARICNVLSKKLGLLDRLVWQEGNLPTGHMVAFSANSLPSGTWRSYNTGVVATSPDAAQYVEACALLEDWSKVDKALAELGGNSVEYRRARDDLKFEGLRQQLSTAIFYESQTTNPTRIHGLAPRYSATTGVTASSYVLAGTNAGVNCHSVWLLTPELGKLYGVYPKGTPMGLQKNDLGQQIVVTNTTTGAQMLALISQLIWNCGIAVEDYRYAVRSQWDPDDAGMDDTERGLILMMQNARETIFDTGPTTMWVMNRTSKKKLRAQLGTNEANLLSSVVLPGRGPVDHFDGIPIILDDMLVAETAIS